MRRPRWLLAAALPLGAALALGAGLLAVPTLPGAETVATDPVSARSVAARETAAAAPTTAIPTTTAIPSTAPPTTAAPTSPAVPAADAAAGVLEAVVPQVGTGETVVVPGSTPAPGTGPVRTVRVEVEGGLPVDGAAFAEFVLATLNDPRSWGAGGAMTFARTDGDAEITVVLASPDTSARMCLPLDTGGRLSCRNGPRAILTHYRWVEAHPDYGDDRTGYRHYLVNHEVGHFLGQSHVPCPAPGAPAPVMQQQTKGLEGCAPNSWPYP